MMPKAAARPKPHARTASDACRGRIADAHSQARSERSYETLEREVRSNVVYRSFCRIGMEKVPDAKILVRLGQALGPEVLRDLHDRLVAIAQERKVIQGRKMRVDTTVVETNIHYPTDSGLLNDGARVLTRTMKKIEQKAGGMKKAIRDRKRRPPYTGPGNDPVAWD
jgi:hypothetical protein